MESTLSEVLAKLKHAEERLEGLNQDFHTLESEKQVHLREIIKGGQGSPEVKRTDQAIKEKGILISQAKEEVANLRSQLEMELTLLRKELIKEKQRELDHFMEQRAVYLRRIEELETEKSRYRYLITGEKDHRLAKEKDPLPLEVRGRGDFVPIDETIGKIKLEVSRINRLSSKALLEEYLASKGEGDRAAQDRLPEGRD
ncbi:MAG: hypothetical protein JRH07_11415 [Deltaproteobacteria bacterium]|nr:hypothetical protein [Deltaproteobacteria bacterium]